MTKKVQILMATYNGAEFIEEQIESIIKQTYQNWELLIRDDLSTDNTLKIVQKYISRYPDKIFLIDNNNTNLGACYNFLKLLEKSSSDYVMFCDQDDIWLPNKIEVTLNKMLEEERIHVNFPLVVHTDLTITDNKLNIIHKSYYNFYKLNPKKHNKINNILVKNALAGCTIIINKKAIDILKIYPKEKIYMHDYWIALVISIFGKIIYVPIQTILYRQHEKNTIGIRLKENKINMFNTIKNFTLKKNSFIQENSFKYEQAKLILEFYTNKLNNNTIQILTIYSNLSSYNFFIRRYLLIKYNFLETDFKRLIRQILFI